MSNEVSKHDVDKIKYEYEKTAKLLLEELIRRIEQSGRNIDNNKIGICIDQGNNRVSNRLVDKSNLAKVLNKEQFEQVYTAISNPEQLKGGVLIFVGQEKIFDVQDGKVITDKLKLSTPSYKQTNDTPRVSIKFNKQEEGNKILNYAKELMDVVRRKRRGESKDFESNYYTFKNFGELISVSAKDGRGEILNNNGLTDAANDTDIERLLKIKDKLNQVLLKDTQKHVQQLKYKSLHL